MADARQTDPHAGADDMRLPDSLRDGVLRHLDHLRSRYEARGWGDAPVSAAAPPCW